jgi:hypothetical protein
MTFGETNPPADDPGITIGRNQFMQAGMPLVADWLRWIAQA